METFKNITINGKPIQGLTFSGGEVHVDVSDNVRGHDLSSCVISANIHNSDDVMRLLLVTDAIKGIGIKDICLFLPYVPYARQDRRCNLGEAHSLKVFAGLINAQQYDSVTVFDPHSDVVEALINNIKVVNNHNFIHHVVAGHITPKYDFFHLVSPDAGAYKKIHHLAKDLVGRTSVVNFDVVTCNKERDTKTGNISNFTVGTNDLGGKPCLIVDDICARGNTFLGLAKSLKERNCGDLYLAVSHDEGIADKEAFKNTGFVKFFKTDSFSDRNDEFFVNFSWSVGQF